jgi:hypothetical protein
VEFGNGNVMKVTDSTGKTMEVTIPEIK